MILSKGLSNVPSEELAKSFVSSGNWKVSTPLNAVYLAFLENLERELFKVGLPSVVGAAVDTGYRFYSRR